MATKHGKLGDWAFMGGVILAIVLGLLGSYLTAYVEAVTYLLIVLGLIVGLVNVKQKEAFNFLIASIALLAVGGAGLDTLPAIGTYIGPILTNIATFVAPAAIVVSLKAINDLASKTA